jgi:CHAT domain-containing protein
LLCDVMLEQAELKAARGDRATALRLAYRAHQRVVDQDWPVQNVHALLKLADLVLPNMPLAELLLDEASQLIGTLALPHLRYRLHQRLGHLYLLQGREQAAEPLLAAAVTEIEGLRGNLAQETIRASFLRDKAAAYEDLTQLYLARGDEISLLKALNVTEQAKSRTLVDMLLGIVDVKLATDVQAEEATRLQQLRAELDTLYNQALRGSHEGERGAPWLELNERATYLENEISRLRLQLADNASSQPSAIPALPFDSLQAQLPPELTLLVYHILADEVLVFVLDHDRLRVKQHLASASAVKKLLQDLEIEWSWFQAGEDFVHRHIGRLEQSVQHVLNQLYCLLLAPIADWLPSSQGKVPQLGIVPHGILHQAPFQALFDGRGYLLDRFEIVYAPSATLLAFYQQKKTRRHFREAIFGVSDPLIPHVTTEAYAVARHLPGAELYLDEKATLADFQAWAPHCSTLHLASHGLFRADNPMFSALRLYDGWLTAADVIALDLTDTLVTLSVCESGRSDGLRSDEILGLTRAFLVAGARALIVTLWLIEDKVSADVMACLYEQLAHGANYSVALRTAQLALKEKMPHPYYWAPFVVIGQMAAAGPPPHDV